MHYVCRNHATVALAQKASYIERSLCKRKVEYLNPSCANLSRKNKE